MSLFTIVYIILDVLILMYLFNAVKTSRIIEIPVSSKAQMVVGAIFVVVGIYGMFYFQGLEGVLRLVQGVIIALLGVGYMFFVRTGLAPVGVVLMGRLLRYDQMKDLDFDHEGDFAKLEFTVKKKMHVLYFNDDDFFKVRDYVKGHK